MTEGKSVLLGDMKLYEEGLKEGLKEPQVNFRS